MTGRHFRNAMLIDQNLPILRCVAAGPSQRMVYRSTCPHWTAEKHQDSINSILRHCSIGRPFAAQDADKSTVHVHLDLMIASQGLCVLRVAHVYQRPRPRTAADDLVGRDWP